MRRAVNWLIIAALALTAISTCVQAQQAYQSAFGIGRNVPGGTPNCALYVNASTQGGCDANNFKYASNTLTIGNAGTTSGSVVIGAAVNANNKLTIGGTNNMVLSANTNAVGVTWQIISDITGSTGPAAFRLGSGGTIGFNSAGGLASGAIDVALSRCAANILCAGTGAQGDFAGTIKANIFNAVSPTLTASAPSLDVSQTWNNAAVTFTGAKISISETAKSASSILFQVLGGASGTTNALSVATGANLAISSAGLNFGGNPEILVGGSRIANFTTSGGTQSIKLSSAGGGGGAYDIGLHSGGAAGTLFLGNGTAGDFSGTLKLTTLQGGTALTLNNASSGTLTFGSNAVTPASTGVRYLCISTTGVITSATSCVGT